MKNEKLISAINLINCSYDSFKKEEDKNKRINILINNLEEKNKSLKTNIIKNIGNNNCVLQNIQNIFNAITIFKNTLEFENNSIKKKQIIANIRTLLNFINSKTTPLDMAFFINNSDMLKEIGVEFEFSGLDILFLLNNGYTLKFKKEYFITLEAGNVFKIYPNLGANNASSVRENTNKASFNSFINKKFTLTNINPNRINFNQKIQNIIDRLAYSDKYMDGYILLDNNVAIKMHNNIIYKTKIEDDIKFTIKNNTLGKIINNEFIPLKKLKASISEIFNIVNI